MIMQVSGDEINSTWIPALKSLEWTGTGLWPCGRLQSNRWKSIHSILFNVSNNSDQNSRKVRSREMYFINLVANLENIRALYMDHLI